MVWRIWTLLLVVIVGGTWLLAVPFSPAPQLKTATVIDTYRKIGLVPPAGRLRVAEGEEHGVFEVPPEDAEHLAAAVARQPAAGGMAMPMPGGGSPMSIPQGSGQTMTMPQQGDQAMPMPDGGQTAPMAGGGSAVPQGSGAPMPMPQQGGQATPMAPGSGREIPMPGGTPPMSMPNGGQMMPMAGDGPGTPQGSGPAMLMPGGDQKMPMAPDSGQTMPMTGGEGKGEGLTVLAVGTVEEVDKRLDAASLKPTVTTALAMHEWGFGSGMIMARPGEIVRLKVRNTGSLPHEFMIMSGSAMDALDYRIRRADWNLLEHEALVEVPIVMPGDSFDMVLRIEASGTWMYMCMFPYHMQFGMMGMLMTPDQMQDGGMSMGGMKM